MSLRYAVAGGLLLLGLLLSVQGAVSTPTATVVECTGSSSAAGETPTATPDCVKYTERSWGQQLYLVGLGVSIAALGVGVVVVDRSLHRP